jgi:pseudaminic acid cytidylyltransferase
MTMSAPLALIPARGGSKRLLRKNILPFAGKPMVAWTIEAALQSGVFERVIVTTDDDEIADIARQYSADVLMRPLAVADDKAGLIDVLHFAADHIAAWSDTICLPLGNCPLRTSQDIANSAKAFRELDCSALLSVVDYGWTPPFRALETREDGLHFMLAEWQHQKSQAYPDVVCPSGAIYWARTNLLKNSDTLYLPGIQGYLMPWERAIDIDTLEDFRLAEGLRFAMDHGYDFRGGISAK